VSWYLVGAPWDSSGTGRGAEQAPAALRAAAGERAAAWAAGPEIPMWLHIDLDVLDPSALPAVTYPQPGGPDSDQLAAVLRPLAGST
jgi:arginase